MDEEHVRQNRSNLTNKKDVNEKKTKKTFGEMNARIGEQQRRARLVVRPEEAEFRNSQGDEAQELERINHRREMRRFERACGIDPW